MQKMEPNEAEIICTIIEPDEDASADFDAWQQEQKADLEASGMVVTKIDGAKFYGYQKPTPPEGKS